MESSDFATKYAEQFILLEYNSGRSDRMVYLRKNSNSKRSKGRTFIKLRKQTHIEIDQKILWNPTNAFVGR